MVKIIMGQKGSGKTKQLIELVNKALDEEQGDVVCLEKGSKLKFDIPHKARLIEASEHDFNGYDFLKGFISGLYSANYDITHIFISRLLKIVGEEVDDRMEEFFQWCDRFSKREGVKFTISVSADMALASDEVKKYF